MNKTAIISGVVGAAIGAVTSWAVTKKILTDRHEKEIASIKAVYTYEKPSIKDLVKEYIINDVDAVNEAYNSIEEAIEASREENDTYEEVLDNLHDIEYTDASEFTTLNGHEKETLTYYSKDDVMTDQNDDPIPAGEVMDMVGDISDYVQTHDEEVIYICNNKLGRDFEVIVLNQEFVDEYPGEEE